MLTDAQREANLGLFDRFMRAWGAAAESSRLMLYADTRAYSAGNETAETLYQQTSELLGIRVP